MVPSLAPIVPTKLYFLASRIFRWASTPPQPPSLVHLTSCIGINTLTHRSDSPEMGCLTEASLLLHLHWTQGISTSYTWTPLLPSMLKAAAILLLSPFHTYFPKRTKKAAHIFPKRTGYKENVEQRRNALGL